MDLDALTALAPSTLRQVLPPFLAGMIDDEAARARAAERLTGLVEAWDDATCREVVAALDGLGDEPRVYEPHPAARMLSRVWCGDVLIDSHVDGLDHLVDAVARGPVVMLSNHLSYLDSSAVDAALAWRDRADLADRILSVAGPRVYSDPFRRIATSCIATLPVPQSNRFAHTESMSPRELARRALASVRAAGEAMTAGRTLLLYGEGSRSRDGRLQPFLQGVHRYLAVEGTIVVPTALVGTDAVMPVGRSLFTPGTLSMRLGEPLPVADHGGPREVLDLVHARIAALLPEDRQPA